MRELVYLSQGKLRQFVVDQAPWWQRLGRRTIIEATTPIGKIGLQPQPPASSETPVTGLPAAIAQVEESAVWYGEPNLVAGAWVYFETSMNCVVLTGGGRLFGGRGRHFVLFVSNSADAHVRLLLHGSSRNLVGVQHADRDAADLDHGLINPSWAGDFLHLLDTVRQPSDFDRGDQPPLEVDDRVGIGFDYMMEALDSRGYLSSMTAEWLAGFARVTVTGPLRSHVIATPLYVQRVPPP